MSPVARPYKLWILVMIWAFLSGPLSALADPSPAPLNPPENYEEIAGPGPPEQAEAPPGEVEYANGVVISVKRLSLDEMPPNLRPMGSMNTLEMVTVRITSGDRAGNTVVLKNLLSGHPAYDIAVKPGDGVLLSIEHYPGKPPDINIADRSRAPVLMILLGLLLLGFLVICGKQGLMMLGILAATLVFTENGLVPAILDGQPPGAIALIGGLGFLALTSRILVRQPQHRQAAFLGSSGGLFITLLLMVFSCHFAALSGFSSEELASLWQSNPNIDFPGILVATGLLSYVGFQLALTSGTLNRLSEPDPTAADRTGNLFHRVYRAGQQEIIPLMTGLVLLQAGIHLTWWFQVLETPAPKFFNLESVASVVAIVLCGSLGLLLSVPLTAAITDRLHRRNTPKAEAA